MRKHFFFTLLFTTVSLISQQKLSKKISFLNDNDLYASKERDQYYSNGMFFSYNYIAKTNIKFLKKIYELQIGHEIYTPYKSTVLSIAEHDRPFAAHLFGKFGISRVYESKQIFKTSLLVGVVGENAMGRELQEFIHNLYNFSAPIGWRYQIKNMLSFNLDATYISAIGTSKYELLDINFISKARIGTVFNNLSAGLMGRVGLKKLQPIENSIAFNTNLNNEGNDFVREVESFLYYQIELSAIAYDATSQGSLFKDQSPITFTPNFLKFDAEVGYRFTANRWNFGYALHYRTNESPQVRNNNGHFYGRIFLGIGLK